MFREWLNHNNIEDYDFSYSLFPKAKEREKLKISSSQELIKNAEKFMDYLWPSVKATDYIAFKTENSRVAQENIHFERRSALVNLFLGEISEYKGRFIPQIVNGIFSICEETFWGVSAHFPPSNYRHNIPAPDDGYIDLFAADTAASLSVIYYMLYDELYDYCPEILTRLEYEMERRIIKSYLTHRDWFWMGYTVPVNNWNPWIISNLITVFLIMEKSKTVRNEGIKKMLFEIDCIYRSYPEDGGCDEGISYWSASGGALGEFCHQIYCATNGKIDFFEDEKLHRVAEYPLRVYIGNGYAVNFADGGNKIGGSGKHTVQSYIYGLHMNDNKLCSFAGELLKITKENWNLKRVATNIRCAVYKLIYFDEMLMRDRFENAHDFELKDLQNSFVRFEKWYYASKGGNNAERHNHNDVGSFIVYYDNEPLLVDPGCGVYNAKTFSATRYDIWTMQSAWHNAPLINGYTQKNGENFKADAFSFNNKKTELSFASAYPKESGIIKLDREISLTENGVILSDFFEFSNENNEISEHFITPLDVEKTENGVVIGGRFLLSADESIRISCDFADFEGDKNLIGYWNTDKMNRMIFSFSSGKKSQISINLKRIN